MPIAVVFVGCGNIGSRLLQSVAKISPDVVGSAVDVYVYEPFSDAVETAKTRFSDVLGDRPHTLHTIESLSDLPAECDVAVIPTDSRNRLAALQSLAAHVRPKQILFEKFLFTQAEDYTVAQGLIDSLGSRAFVNTSRNAWRGYQQLKKQLNKTQINKISVAGPDWNLGSNGIHFLALFEFLLDQEIEHLSIDQVFSQTESKRSGYKEFSGVMKATAPNGGSLLLTSDPKGAPPLVVEIFGKDENSDDVEIDIRESAGEMTVSIGAETKALPFEMNHASDLSHVFEAMINNEAPLLPGFKESAALHLKTMRVLNGVFHHNESLDLECPVS